jgi:cysteine-rich repeat protein
MSFRSIHWRGVARSLSWCGLGALSLSSVGCLSKGTVQEGEDDFKVGTVQEAIETYRSARVFIGGLQYDMANEDDFGGNYGAGQARTSIDPLKWTPVNLGVNFESQAYTQRQCSDARFTNADAALEKWNICQANGALTLMTRKENLSCVVWQQCSTSADCIEGGTCSTGWCTYDKNGNSIVDAAECAPYGGGGENAPGNNTKYSSGRIESFKWIEQPAAGSSEQPKVHGMETGMGYVEFRAKMPFADAGLGLTPPPDGLWPAIWSMNGHSMLGKGEAEDSVGWPMNAELDVMEYIQMEEGVANERAMGFNALFRERNYGQSLLDDNWWLPQACSSWPDSGHERCDGNKNNATKGTWNGVNIDYTHWHTWGMLRDENSIKIYIQDDDGPNTSAGMTDCLPYQSGCSPVATMDISGIGADEYKQPYYWILNQAIGGELGCNGWKNRAGEYADTCLAPFPWTNNYNPHAKLVVDYIRYYKKANDTYAPATSACGSGTNASNLIVNCGFDENHRGHRTDAFWGGAVGQVDVVDDGGTHGPVESFRIGKKGSEAWNVQMRQEGFTLQQGHTYTWSVDLKSVSFGAATLTMRVVESPNADGDTTNYEQAATTSTASCAITQGTWMTCSGPQFTVTNGSGKYKFVIEAGGIATGELYYDNMILKDNAAPTAVCGDGKKEGTEQCDDGNTVTENNCAYSPSGPPSCPQICDSACKLVAPTIKYCGDGVVQGGEGEQCDDGNAVNSDACRTNCLRSTCQDGLQNQGETGVDCGGPCVACGGGSACNTTQNIAMTAATSTNSTLSPASMVYDGSITTRWETAHQDPCGTLCDNGPELEVDFGQNRYVSQVAFDWETASASTYTLERYNGGTWTTVGTKTGGTLTQHRIDTFSNVNAVASKLRIKVAGKNGQWGLSIWEVTVKGDNNAACSSGPGMVCGNGIKETSGTNTEGCDDGNTVTETCAYGQSSCQVCSATCVLQAGATSYCGNASTDAANGEQCDDGNGVDTDSCKNTCKVNVGVCGDGVVNNGEACDDGNNATESCGGAQSCTVCQSGCVFGPGTVTQCSGTTKLSTSATASASSVETAGYEANKANDNNTGTRWSSQYSDNQWLQVNLGARKNVSSLVIDWEAAYANQFKIQLSDNGTDWALFGEYSKGNDGDDTITINKPAQYVRMQGVKRGTTYGYSVFEFAVYGSDLTCTPACTPSCSGKQCGSDGCGGVCGTGPNGGCGASLKCNASNQCVNSCGDGVLHAGETCDDANTNNNDGCTQQCKYEACGDGYVQTTGTGSGQVTTNEGCDDGNLVNGDSCNAACQADSLLLQAEVGANNGCSNEGGGDMGNKFVLNSSGDSVCWSTMVVNGVTVPLSMAGKTKVTMHYACGEVAGDQFLVKYNTVQLGSLPLDNTNGWSSGSFKNGVVTFAAQSGTGTLCVEGSGTGWIGSLDYIQIQ